MKLCFLADAGSIHTRRWAGYFSGKGYQVDVISFNPGAVPGARVHVVGGGKINPSGGNWKVLFNMGSVKQLLREIKPDVLHAHYATSYGLVGALSGLRPFVVTGLGSDILVTPDKSILYRVLTRYVLHKADHITAMAPHMEHKILSFKIPPHKVSVIMFGIDPRIFNPAHRSIPENKFVLVSTRNFEPVYNIFSILKAVSKIKNEIPGIELIMIGTGSQRSEIENACRDLEISDRVRFTGRIPQAEIAEHLNAAHVFLSMSYSDGNNVSLNEAMACNVFALASRIPANTQWIKDGENGFLIQPDDVDGLAEKILYVYRNRLFLPDRFSVLNSNIIQEKALWEKNMERMKGIYEKLTHDKKK